MVLERDKVCSVPARIASGRTIYAIGDIHGRHDLLLEIVDRICADFEAGLADFGGTPDRPMVVLLGDYVDRGPQGLACLRKVMDLVQGYGPGAEPWADWLALAGNHEDMLLSAIKGSRLDVRGWLDNGGDALLRELGMTEPFDDFQAALFVAEQVGEEIIAWLGRLPLLAETDGTVFVHAGVDPDRPLDNQDRNTLLWTRRRAFIDRLDDLEPGYRVIHGHTITRMPIISKNRINIDTGAYASGCLTAVRLSPYRSLGLIQTG